MKTALSHGQVYVWRMRSYNEIGQAKICWWNKSRLFDWHGFSQAYTLVTGAIKTKPDRSLTLYARTQILCQFNLICKQIEKKFMTTPLLVLDIR